MFNTLRRTMTDALLSDIHSKIPHNNALKLPIKKSMAFEKILMNQCQSKFNDFPIVLKRRIIQLVLKYFVI